MTTYRQVLARRIALLSLPGAEHAPAEAARRAARLIEARRAYGLEDGVLAAEMDRRCREVAVSQSCAK